jgi:hypothetical protein
VIGDEARRLGIDYISRANTEEPSGVLYFMPTSGGMVPTDPNTITDWIDRVIADPLYADTTDKLLKREADERHVFMMSGSLTDFGEEERLRRAADALPTRSPIVPDGITHVWGVARYGAAPVVLWVAGVGWTTVPAPNLDALYDT